MNSKLITPLVSVVAVGVWMFGLYTQSFLLSAVGAYYCFPGMHDACHGSTYDWVGHLSCVPLLVPYVEFRHLHRQHHAHTNDSKLDPDHITTRTSPFMWFFIPEIYIVFWARTRQGKNMTIARRARGISSYLGMLGLVLLAWWCFGWYAALVNFFLASRVALVALVYLLDVLPHRGRPKKPRHLATKDIQSPASPWLFALTAGQCYHQMHHTNPRVPWHQLGPTY